MNQVARTKPGEKVSVEVMRNGKIIELSAEVGLRPRNRPHPRTTTDPNGA